MRERTDDIGDLVRHFFQIAANEGLPSKRLDMAALDRLKKYRWPGNIRELENLTRRLAALYPQEVIGEALVEAELRHDVMAAEPSGAYRSASPRRARNAPEPANSADTPLAQSVERHLATMFKASGDSLPPPGLYHRILREIEYPLLATVLAATRGNQIKAAELLGLNRNTLRKKVRDLEIKMMRLPR